MSEPVKVSGRANRATIDDVAALAGVSTKTVSRVVNAEPRVRPATREKVQAAISELDYRPNMSARSLAGSRSFLIGLVHDRPSPDYLMEMQMAVQKQCVSQAYYMLMHRYNTNDDSAWAQLETMIEQSRLDGLVLTPPVCDDQAMVNRLKEAGVPYVLVAPDVADADEITVGFDEFEAARCITQHLIDQGHSDIGHIIGHPDHGASSKREAGFRKAMKDAGLTVNEKWVAQGLFSYKSGMECAEKILEPEIRPTAIFAADDDMAAGVLAVAGKKGLSVPDDLSIAGINDTPLASIVWPNLTTIRQPIARMGAGAVDLLINSIRARRSGDDLAENQLLFPYELKVRPSTAKPSGQ